MNLIKNATNAILNAIHAKKTLNVSLVITTKIGY